MIVARQRLLTNSTITQQSAWARATNTSVRAKTKAQRTACLSNTRQLGLALLAYMNDTGNLMRYQGPGPLTKSAALPGSINIEFYDGRAENVRLEDPWSLYWHRDYVAPPNRPRWL